MPEIPSAPTLPELPELPAFPANSKNENLNEEMVKSAVSDMPSPRERRDIPSDIHRAEEQGGRHMPPPFPSGGGMIPSIQSLQDPEEKKTLELRASSKLTSSTKQVEPIFVRIDKFQSAQKDFEQIKENVKEIESVLKKIKDVKAQEEVELKGWTEDIEKIKSRLAEVDAGIFDQI